MKTLGGKVMKNLAAMIAVISILVGGMGNCDAFADQTNGDTVLTLEKLEEYARDIKTTDEQEGARIRGELVDKIGSVGYTYKGRGSLYWTSSPFIPEAVRSLTEAGELSRQFMEANFYLEQAKWRVEGGAHALVEAKIKALSIENARQRYGRAVAVGDAIARRCHVLLRILLNSRLIEMQRPEPYSYIYILYIQEGVDYREVSIVNTR